MSWKNYFIVSALLIFTYSCGISHTKDSIDHSELNIDLFTSIPEKIDGCSCLFSSTKELYENNEYIFASNYDSLGFISINKEMTILKLVSSGRDQFSFGDYDHIDIFKNENYIVTVEMKYKESSGEETWIDTGAITVENNKGEKITTSFYGECGC